MKKKILLVWPSSARQNPPNWPPLGISYLASYIAAFDSELQIKLIDYDITPFSKDIWQHELSTYQPDIVGISILMLNAANGMQLARVAKQENHDIITVLGGGHASIFPHECLKYSDIAVRGEGEKTFLEIIQGMDLASIKGISYLRDREFVDNPPRERISNLDELPLPLLDSFDMERYLEGGLKSGSTLGSEGVLRAGTVLGSRGCPYGCTFCASQQFWGRAIKFRSVKNIVDEIEFLQAKYRLDKMNFQDDTINIPQNRAVEICDEIIKRGLNTKLQFYSLIRANKNFVSPKLFQKMKAANFVQVSLGIESASPKVLKAMQKDLAPEEVRSAIKMARKAKIPSVTGNFMVGNWDESFLDVLKTWYFVLFNNVEPLFWICTPYPGTEFSRRLMAAGYLDSGYSWLIDFKPGTYTPVSRTNKLSKISISILYFDSVLFQLVLMLFRGKHRDEFLFFTRRAISEARKKLVRK
jgi:radical SAM superfamily enzyme YgiQ (UPF0313 family)